MSQRRTSAEPPRPDVERLDDRIVPNATPTQIMAVGTDPGNVAEVRVFDAAGSKTFNFTAYNGRGYIGGVRVATGDLTGDGVDDIITAPGPGMKSLIQVYDGVSGQKILSFNAYDPSFQGGAYVAAGDVNGDGRMDLVVGAGDTGGSHVKVFDGAALFPAPGATVVPPGPNTNLIREFFAYDPKYLVGARVAVADVNGDGKADIVTGAGGKGGAHVRIFSGEDGTIIREFFAYDAALASGVNVAAGDLDGDGKAEVVTGTGPRSGARVNVYDGRDGRLIRSFTQDDALPSGASMRVGVLDTDHDGHNELVLGVLSELRYFNGKTYVRTGGMTPYDPGYIGGVNFG